MSQSRTYPNRPIIAVSTLIKNPGKEILIVRRAGAPGKGLWSLPGGAIELGEKLEDALKRGIWEECHITTKIEKLTGAFNRIFRDEKQRVKYHYVVLNYLCHTTDKSVQPAGDVDKYAWIKQKTGSQYRYTEGVEELILEYLSL